MTNGAKKLVVDKAWHVVNLGKILVEINGEHYIAFTKARPIELQEVSETWLKGRQLKEFLDYEYIVRDLEKRSGYNVELGRIITSEELAEVKTKYGATVGKPFADQKGAFYGKEYTKHYTSVNIRVADEKALHLEKYLEDKGIEACNVAHGIVSVRVTEELINSNECEEQQEVLGKDNHIGDDYTVKKDNSGIIHYKPKVYEQEPAKLKFKKRDEDELER